MTVLNLLLGLITIILAVIAYFFFQHNTKVSSSLKQINTNSGSLNSTLIEHKIAVEKMPSSFENIVSKELGVGMNDLVKSIDIMQGNLAKTHQSFEQLFQNIPQLDHMPNWLTEVKRSIKPLEVAAKSLDDFDEKVIQRFDTFMNGREEFENAFTSISNLISEWTMESNLEREEFKKMIETHLSNLREQTDKMKESMTEVQIFAAKNGELIQGISQELPESITSLNSLIRSLDKLNNNSLDNAEKVSKLIDVWETRVKSQQWLVWGGYGLMTINIIILVALIIKQIP